MHFFPDFSEDRFGYRVWFKIKSQKSAPAMTTPPGGRFAGICFDPQQFPRKFLGPPKLPGQ